MKIPVDKIPHAILLVGKKAFSEASAWAYQLVGGDASEGHPDVHIYHPEGKLGMHPIQTVKLVIQELILAPYCAPWKVVIFQEADRMLPPSANALLKVVEEPPARSVIILTTNYPDRILATLRSRCHRFIASGVENEELPLKKEFVNFLAEGDFSFEKLEKVAALCESEEVLEYQGRVTTLFETILFWFRDRAFLEIAKPEQLHFLDYQKELKEAPFFPLEELQKSILQAQVAFERSLKLSLCLERVLGR